MAVGVGIAISSIKEEEFKFSDNNLDSIDSKLLSLGYHLGFNVDVKKSSFTVKFTVVYNYDNENKNKKDIQLLKFTTLTKYKVKGLKKIVNFDQEEDDKFEIPDPIMITFVGAAISSTRGMLAYKLSGTILSDYYLPLIDVQKLLKGYDDSFSGSKKEVIG
jgi:hypothetical protein